MRPIPAPRLGDTHGLLRAINQRDRVRLDEFITEFSVEDLFPPGLENALGRTRQFVSFARSAGLLNEDRGVVELTEVGKRYVRSGDEDAVFDVSSGQAEWLRRQLFERHMTDSIYHGTAIGLSLFASNPPDFHVSRLDFGRALAHLGRAGWDNENTLESQGERYTTFLRDLELLDDQSQLTEIGTQTKAELTLPVHMSMRDLAGQLNPGGIEAAEAEGEAEWAAQSAAPEPEPEPEPAAVEPEPEEEADEPITPPAIDTGEYEDVAGAAAQAAAAEPPGRPIPPSDIWETAAPDEVTRAYSAISPEQAAAAAVEGSVPPPGAPVEDEAVEEEAVEEPAVEEPGAEESVPPAGMTSGDPLAQEAPVAVNGPGVEPADPDVAADAPSAEEPDPEPADDAPLPVVGLPAELAEEPADDDEAATAEAALAETDSEEPAVDAEDEADLADRAAASALAAGLSEAPPGAGEAGTGGPVVEDEEPAGEEVPVGDGAAAPVEAAVSAGAEAPLEEPAVEAEEPAVEAGAPALEAPDEPAVEAEEPAVAAASAATSTRAPSGFLDIAAVKAAAEGDGLKLPDSVYAAVVAALATGKHVVIAGPAGSGKTTLALAIAKAAVQAGRSEGAALATASPKWTASDTVGRVGEGGFSMGHVLAAAGKKKWLVIDEIERAKPDKAFGDLSSFLAGLPLSLPDGSREVAAPKDWRIVATRDSSRGSGSASAALQRRFAEIRLPRPDAPDLDAAVDAATEGDPTAASVVKRLLADESLDSLGAGAFLDAARHAAERNAILPASEEELEAELRTAYLNPHLEEDD
jgi:MoxR-like ATPase